MDSFPKPTVHRLPPWEMRRIFNDELRILQRVQAREVVEEVVVDKHPSESLAGEPFCTKSQLVSYRDRFGSEIARAHRYKRTDGTIGGSGRPDPKWLCIDGTLYKATP